MPSGLYTYTLRLHRDVVSALYKMPRKAVEDVWTLLRGLEKEPIPESSSAVEGHELTYQIRSGGYRIVYEILEDEKAIKVVRVHLVE